MIHPQYWSIDSIYKSIEVKRHRWTEYDTKHYLKFLNVRDKIVLDIGASWGDTAKAFLKAGAKRVICIEKEFSLCSQIPFSEPLVKIYCEKFDPEKHLFSDPYDCIKMDIEGYERTALPYLKKIDKPMIVEVHNHEIKDRFLEHGFKFYTEPDDMLGLCLMTRN